MAKDLFDYLEVEFLKELEKSGEPIIAAAALARASFINFARTHLATNQPIAARPDEGLVLVFQDGMQLPVVAPPETTKMEQSTPVIGLTTPRGRSGEMAPTHSIPITKPKS